MYVDGPFSEIVVDGGPPRKVVWEHAPLAAASQDVEYGVEDLSQAVDPWSAVAQRARHVRLDVLPLIVGEIRQVRFSHAC